jgi:hypothetical protein
MTMATNLNQWKTDSTAVLPTPAQPNPTITTAGTIVNPFKWPLPAKPVLSGAGPQTPPMLFGP